MPGLPAIPNPLGLLSSVPNPFAAMSALSSIARSAERMADDTAMLGEVRDHLLAIEQHLHAVETEVTRMRARVDVMGDDVVALQRLESQLADVSTAIAPLRRLGGRAGRRRELPTDAPDAA